MEPGTFSLLERINNNIEKIALSIGYWRKENKELQELKDKVIILDKEINQLKKEKMLLRKHLFG